MNFDKKNWKVHLPEEEEDEKKWTSSERWALGIALTVYIFAYMLHTMLFLYGRVGTVSQVILTIGALLLYSILTYYKYKGSY
jgi:hypothetical protein